MAKKSKHITKIQEKEVTAKILAIMNKYNLSPSQLFRIMAKTSTPMNSWTFRVPEEKRLKHYLPDEMILYILSVPDYKTYRPCQLRDMVLEKFPDSGYSNKKIYDACNYLINKERYVALQQKWSEEHHERCIELAKKNWRKRVALYKEAKAKYKEEDK